MCFFFRVDEAVEDCNKSLAIDANFLKSYLRRGSAYMLLNKNKLATSDYEKVKISVKYLLYSSYCDLSLAFYESFKQKRVLQKSYLKHQNDFTS